MAFFLKFELINMVKIKLLNGQKAENWTQNLGFIIVSQGCFFMKKGLSFKKFELRKLKSGLQSCD